MAAPQSPLQRGDPAPEFVLPSASQEGTVALADLRGRPFLLGLFRGLHCPFCRRQVVQLAAQQPALQAAGVARLGLRLIYLVEIWVSGRFLNMLAACGLLSFSSQVRSRQSLRRTS